ncbi:ATPase, K+ transporting, KdpC subunit, partial [mine drainage metagenome]
MSARTPPPDPIEPREVEVRPAPPEPDAAPEDDPSRTEPTASGPTAGAPARPAETGDGDDAGPHRPEVVRPAHSAGEHLRAALVVVVLSLFLVGIAYPVAVAAVAQVLDPSAANGSLLYYPNGTVAGSALVAQNLSAPYLFWERPSLADYNLFNGSPTPPGPSDPALVNETLSYM